MKLFGNKNLLSLTLGLCLCLTSCLDDDNQPLPVYSTLGTVTSVNPAIIDTDMCGEIQPENPGILSSEKSDSIGQRVLANLYITSDDKDLKRENIKITNLYKVLTKNANETRFPGTPSPDSFGNSPIQVTGLSISKEHLNVQFNTLGGDQKIPHRISLLLTEKTELDEDGYLRLDLRHDANGDVQSIIFWGIASFTLRSIPEFNDPKCKGVRLYYNSGANPESVWPARKQPSKSDESAFLRVMETSQEVSNVHSLLTSQLQ